METPGGLRDSTAFNKKKPSLANFWEDDSDDEKDASKVNPVIGTPTKKPAPSLGGLDSPSDAAAATNNNNELPASLESSRSALKKGFPTKPITILNNDSATPESPSKNKMGFVQDSSESYVKNGLVDNLVKKRMNSQAQDIEEDDIFSSDDDDDDSDSSERKEENPEHPQKQKSFPTQPQLSMFSPLSQQPPSVSPLQMEKDNIKLDKSRIAAPEPKHHSLPPIPPAGNNANVGPAAIPTIPTIPTIESHMKPAERSASPPLMTSFPKSMPTSAEITGSKKAFPSFPTATTQSANTSEMAANEPTLGGSAALSASQAKIKTKSLLDMTDMRTFLATPIPQEYGMFECFVTRERSSLGGLFFPKYYMWFEKKGLFLMGARKRKKNKSSNYLISQSKTDLSRKSKNYVGKVRSNMLGTQFQIFDDGENPKKARKARPRNQLGAVFYEPNPFGYKGPRKLLVVIPDAENGKTAELPQDSKHTLVQMYKNGEWSKLRQFQNKSPTWNEKAQAYVLNFNGRVSMASIKNFQLVEKDDPNNVYFQFGKVDKDKFTLDFRYPFSPTQAFSIAISAFDTKILCE